MSFLKKGARRHSQQNPAEAPGVAPPAGRSMRRYWALGFLSCIVFLSLLMVRLDVLQSLLSGRRTLNMAGTEAGERRLPERDSWMNIVQNGRKIGFSNQRMVRIADGYRVHEMLRMRINTMGMMHDINLKTDSRLNPDMTLAEFDFEIHSGRFHFQVSGAVVANVMKISTQGLGARRDLNIPLKQTPYISAGLIDTVTASGLELGKSYHLEIFDPATMGQVPVEVKVLGQEEILFRGRPEATTKITFNFKGAVQTAWVDGDGEIIREQGLLGISLEKTTRQGALDGMALEASQDLTRIASIAANKPLAEVERLRRLELSLRGIGANVDNDLAGGRQQWANGILTITKEKLPAALPDQVPIGDDIRRFLKASAFIQADHPKIAALARDITDGIESPPLKARSLLDWVYQNIRKQPVISLPDALSTLENRMGDCNEHAVLFAALCRAAGIPAKIESGLVYLKGRFYYHAWNALYLDGWTTADALFGQFPADVTHVRLSGGSQADQLDLMGIIGNITLEIIRAE